MEDKNFLSNEPISKLLFKLSLPTIIAQIVNMLYNIVDRIYIGHIKDIGSLALTGVGICMPLIVIITAFAGFVSSGGAPLASISMGQNNNEKAEKILGNCITIQIIISIILTITFLLFLKPILIFFGASKNTINFSISYMRIYALGTIFVELTLGLNAFITAQGFSKISMWTVIIGTIINIILDPIFIYILNMGVSGAALATVISQSVSCIWVLVFLNGNSTILKIKFKNFKVDKKILISCIALGLSTVIMQGSEAILNICFNTSLLKYGGDIAVGTMTILSSIMMFIMLPLQGLSQGSQPITSFNFGAKKKDRVKESFKLLSTISLCYSSILCIIIIINPKLFAQIFTNDTILINATIPAMRIYFIGLLLMGYQIACQMTFVSIGSAKCSIIVAVLRKFILLIPLIYILPNFFNNKLNAVLLAEPIADIISVIFTTIFFNYNFKIALNKINE